MPLSAITGPRRKEVKEPINVRGAENKEEEERVSTGRKKGGF